MYGVSYTRRCKLNLLSEFNLQKQSLTVRNTTCKQQQTLTLGLNKKEIKVGLKLQKKYFGISIVIIKFVAAADKLCYKKRLGKQCYKCIFSGS